MATITIKNNKGTETLGTYQTQSYGLDMTVTATGATFYDGSKYYYFAYGGSSTFRGFSTETYSTEPTIGIGDDEHWAASAASATYYVTEEHVDIVRIDVKGKVATVRGQACIVCGNSDYLVRFAFDDAWSAATEKTARFVYRALDGVHHVNVPFTGTDLFAPILSGVDTVLIGVYAGELVTSTPAKVPCKRSILCDSGTEAGAPVTYDELAKRVAELEARLPSPGAGTEGLAYDIASVYDRACTGIGSCTDTDIVLAAKVEGKAITNIKANAFNGNKFIETVVIPEGYLYMRLQAFYNCSSLRKVSLPDTLLMLNDSVFRGCSALKAVELPPNLTTIGYSCFNDCTALMRVYIPSTIPKIGPYMFTDCKSLTDIYFAGTMAEWEALPKDNTWNTNTGAYTIHCTDGDIAKTSTASTDEEG